MKVTFNILMTLAVIAVICIIFLYIKRCKESFAVDFDAIPGIDHVYYINLSHRTDRKEQITNELSRMGIPSEKISRIDAILNKEHGGIGCSMSHIKTCKEFIDSPYKTCLILEDDFLFKTSPQELRQFFNNLASVPYDLCMLAANQNDHKFKAEPTEYPFIRKVYDAQTASAYCVNKTFAPTLLHTLEEGLEKLKMNPTENNLYMNDMYWKTLQPISRWYLSTPVMGEQRQSYSDINHKVVYYNA